jgi:hypothetical protein
MEMVLNCVGHLRFPGCGAFAAAAASPAIPVWAAPCIWAAETLTPALPLPVTPPGQTGMGGGPLAAPGHTGMAGCDAGARTATVSDTHLAIPVWPAAPR